MTVPRSLWHHMPCLACWREGLVGCSIWKQRSRMGWQVLQADSRSGQSSLNGGIFLGGGERTSCWGRPGSPFSRVPLQQGPLAAGQPLRRLWEGRLWHVLACGGSHGTATCSGPQAPTPSANLPGCSIHPGDLRGCSGAIRNILMTILTPLIVNDEAISLSIAA